jgi:hypothetical protein
MPQERQSRFFQAVRSALRRRLGVFQLSRRSWPLIAHLALFALAIMLPLLIFAALSLHVSIQAERRTLYDSTQWLADRISNNLEREMASIITLLNVLAQDSAFDRGDYQMLYMRAEEGLRGRSGDVLLFGRDSRPLFHTAFPFGAELPEVQGDGSGREVMRTGQARVSNLFLGEVSRQHRISVIVPIIRSSEVVGRMHLSLAPEDLTSLIAPWGMKPRWSFALADRNLRYLMSSDLTGSPVGSPLRAETAARLTQDGGRFRDLGHSGEASLMAYRRSTLVGWTALATVPIAVVEQPLTAVWRDITLTGIAA